MTRRSRAREVVLQLLFEHDVNADVPAKGIASFIHDRLNDATAEPFCQALYEGVLQHRKEIDAKLTAVAENWKIHRMAGVDRNVLRLGVYEMLYMPQPTPGPVAINESIELARRFGSADSPGFVNGILDKVFRQQQTSSPSA